MSAYHGSSELKSKFVAEITKHEIMNKVRKGTYGTIADGTWRGCAVACSIRSMSIINNCEYPTNRHSLYPELIGVPVILARLEDGIFESLPSDLAKTWPRRFAEAINPGADLSDVWPRFAIWLLTDEEHGVIRYAQSQKSIDIINSVADMYISGDYLDADKVALIRKDAAAYDDAAAATAYDAAAAAYDAAAAYAYDARQNARIAQAEKLLQLLSQA